ncbi:MAG: tetratricopeptide repeat protein [bacterium]|nr:tetratricopeptide repeat protein [bacterium]
MMGKIIILTLTLFSFNAVSGAIASADTEELNNFALKCSEDELWGEAEFRLKRAIEIDDSDARLHNNLAVAFEAQGKLEEAYREYLRAVNLDATNDKYGYNLSEFIKTHKWDVNADTSGGDDTE